MKLDAATPDAAGNLGQEIRAGVHAAQAARGSAPGHAVRDAVHAVLAGHARGSHVAPPAAPRPPPPELLEEAPAPEPGTLLDVSA